MGAVVMGAIVLSYLLALLALRVAWFRQPRIGIREPPATPKWGWALLLLAFLGTASIGSRAFGVLLTALPAWAMLPMLPRFTRGRRAAFLASTLAPSIWLVPTFHSDVIFCRPVDLVPTLLACALALIASQRPRVRSATP